jgi:hypothetical protein
MLLLIGTRILQETSDAAWLREVRESEMVEGGSDVPCSMPPQMDQAAALRHTNGTKYAMPASLQDQSSELNGWRMLCADRERSLPCLQDVAGKGNQLWPPEVTSSDSLDIAAADLHC